MCLVGTSTGIGPLMAQPDINPEGNPDGKGLVPVMDALNALRPWAAAPKAPETILRDFCLSTLVLSARFDFRVVPNKTYYLYRAADGWRLSLISPSEWGKRCPGPFIAEATLATDMTWDMQLSSELGNDPALVDELSQHLQGFLARLSVAETLEDALPTYEACLPYQQRMMATALSSSLQTSLLLSGLAGQSGQVWLKHDGLRRLLSLASDN